MCYVLWNRKSEPRPIVTRVSFIPAMFVISVFPCEELAVINNDDNNNNNNNNNNNDNGNNNNNNNNNNDDDKK